MKSRSPATTNLKDGLDNYTRPRQKTGRRHLHLSYARSIIDFLSSLSRLESRELPWRDVFRSPAVVVDGDRSQFLGVRSIFVYRDRGSITRERDRERFPHDRSRPNTLLGDFAEITELIGSTGSSRIHYICNAAIVLQIAVDRLQGNH